MMEQHCQPQIGIVPSACWTAPRTESRLKSWMHSLVPTCFHRTKAGVQTDSNAKGTTRTQNAQNTQTASNAEQQNPAEMQNMRFARIWAQILCRNRLLQQGKPQRAFDRLQENLSTQKIQAVMQEKKMRHQKYLCHLQMPFQTLTDFILPMIFMFLKFFLKFLTFLNVFRHFLWIRITLSQNHTENEAST